MASQKLTIKTKVVQKKKTATRTVKTRTIKTGDGLTPQQLIVVSQLSMGKTKQEAADKAGVTLAGVTSMLRMPKVDKALADAKKEILEHAKQEAKIDVDDLIRELIPILKMDVRGLFNEDGSLRAMSDWPENYGRVISGIDVEELFEGRGKDKSKIGYLRKVRFWSKTDAVDKLAKIIGAYRPERHIHGGDPDNPIQYGVVIVPAKAKAPEG